MSILNLPHAIPRIILFDWHATLVDTRDAMYHAVDDVLPKLVELGLPLPGTYPQSFLDRFPHLRPLVSNDERRGLF